MMNRTAFALFLFTALIAGSARPVGADERPDVLFIALDDLNDWVGVLGGHPQAKTPNIDRLARRGMLFTNAHTVVPMCAPTRSALLTGLRPETSGIYGPGVDFQTVDELRDTVTLPMHFRQNGYRVIGGGKIFHAHTLASRGFQGFQHKPSWDAYYPSFERQLPEEVRPRAWPANKNPNMSYGLFDWSPVATEDYAMGDGQVVNWAVEQLRRKREQPLFLAVGIYRPHMPWYVPRKYFDLFPLEEIELPPTVADDRADLPEIAKQGVTYQAHQWVVETGGWKAAVQAYLASIAFADEMVGRLLDALDASDRADETIIVLWSDHGYHLGEKGYWHKYTIWEESTRIPMIFVAPGVTQPNTRTDQPVSLQEIYPTLTRLAGLSLPDHVEGHDMTPLLKDQGAPWDHAAVSAWGQGNYSVRGRRYRYTRYQDGSEELYDHDDDPHEWRNLASDPSRAPVKAKLAAHLPQSEAPSRNRTPAIGTSPARGGGGPVAARPR